MPTREDMHSLGEGMTQSYDDRMRGIEQQRQAVREELKDIHNAEAAMRSRTKQDLTNSHQQLHRQGQAVDQQLRQVNDQRTNAVKSELHQFDQAERDMAAHLKQDLANSTAQKRAKVATELHDLDRSESAMRAQLRSDLAKNERARRSQAQARSQSLRQEAHERRESVKTHLDNLDTAEKGMKDRLKAELDEAERERKARAKAHDEELAKKLADMRTSVTAELRTFGITRKDMSEQLHSELFKGFTNLKAAMSRQLKELADIEIGSHMEWEEIEKKLQSMRKEHGVRVEVGGAAKTVAEAVAAPAPTAPTPPTMEREAEAMEVEEQAVEQPEAAAEAGPEMRTMADRVFQYLAEHPDGTRLVDLEQEFGISRIQMARVVRDLMDQDKVTKRDNLYFAI